MKKMLLMVVTGCLLAVGTAAYGVVAWSEDFEGFAAGDLIAQDSTWSYTYTGGGAYSPVITVDASGDWPLTASQGAILGGYCPDVGYPRAIVTKNLSAVSFSNDPIMSVAFSAYPSAWSGYHGLQGYIDVAKADGTSIAKIEINRLSDVTNFKFNGVSFLDPSGDEFFPGDPYFANYVIAIDFAAQKASLSMNGVDMVGLVDLLASSVGSDVAQMNFGSGGYWSGAMFFGYWVDDMAITQVPEPMTLSLLALGGLAALRRRR